MNNIDKLIDAGSNIRVEVSPDTLKEFGVEIANHAIQNVIENINAVTKKEKTGYITGEKVCHLFSISRGTLWKWDQRGVTKPIRIGNIKRYRLSDLKNLDGKRATEQDPFLEDFNDLDDLPL